MLSDPKKKKQQQKKQKPKDVYFPFYRQVRQGWLYAACTGLALTMANVLIPMPSLDFIKGTPSTSQPTEKVSPWGSTSRTRKPTPTLPGMAGSNATTGEVTIPGMGGDSGGVFGNNGGQATTTPRATQGSHPIQRKPGNTGSNSWGDILGGEGSSPATGGSTGSGDVTLPGYN